MQCVPRQQEAVRTVMTPTTVTREVPVTRMVAAQQEGTRRVCQMVPVTQTTTVSYCERVPYQTTIQVPVVTPCATPAQPCCH
jgi:hypothetical protein